MILISASDNKGVGLLLRTCSDATLGRETKPGLAQGIAPGVSFSLVPASGQHRRAKVARQVSLFSAPQYTHLRRFGRDGFLGSGLKRRYCLRSTRGRHQ